MRQKNKLSVNSEITISYINAYFTLLVSLITQKQNMIFNLLFIQRHL